MSACVCVYVCLDADQVWLCRLDVCVCECVRAYVRACVRACVCVCVHACRNVAMLPSLGIHVLSSNVPQSDCLCEIEALASIWVVTDIKQQRQSS